MQYTGGITCFICISALFFQYFPFNKKFYPIFLMEYGVCRQAVLYYSLKWSQITLTIFLKSFSLNTDKVNTKRLILRLVFYFLQIWEFKPPEPVPASTVFAKCTLFRFLYLLSFLHLPTIFLKYN